MAIHAEIHTGYKFSKQEVIELCRRSGVRFIELVLNKTAKTPIYVSSFDDVYINLPEGQRVAKVEYKSGEAMFEPDKFGTLSTLVPRTPHNMDLLASHFRQNPWTIMDEKIRDEVQKMAFDQKKYPWTEEDQKNLKKSKRNWFGEQRKSEDVDVPIVEDSAVDVKEPPEGEKIYTQEELNKMPYFTLMTLAKKLKLVTSKKTKKSDLLPVMVEYFKSKEPVAA